MPRPAAGLLLAGVVLVTIAAAAIAGRLSSTSLSILIGAGLLFAFLARDPARGLVVLSALSFTLPLQIGTGSEVALTAPVLLVPALTAAWVLDGLRRQSLQLPRSRALLPLFLFVCGGLLSLVAGNAYWDPFVPRPGNLLAVQLGQWAIFALSGAAFLMGAVLGRQERWLRSATFAFLVLGLVVVLHWFIVPLWQYVRWQQAANSAMFWVWLGALAVGQLAFNRRLGRRARIYLLVLLFSATYVVWILQADWAAGWLPFTVAVVTVLLLWIWQRSHGLAVLALMVTVIVAGAVFPAVLAHTGGERELDISWGGRQVLYRATLDLVKLHPVLGLGPASYRHYGFTRRLTMGFGKALYVRPLISSHNNYIDVYAQFGLVGCALFLWFLVAVGHTGWRLLARFRGDFAQGYVTGGLGGLAGTLVAMMLIDCFTPFVYNVGFAGFRTSALAWMFLGGLVALEQVGQGTEERGSEGSAEPAS